MKPEIIEKEGKLELNHHYPLKKINNIDEVIRVINSMELHYILDRIKKHNITDLFEINN